LIDLTSVIDEVVCTAGQLAEKNIGSASETSQITHPPDVEN
jgi:hypothetical protein